MLLATTAVIDTQIAQVQLRLSSGRNDSSTAQIFVFAHALWKTLDSVLIVEMVYLQYV